jgi:hypothetical protein
VPAHLRDALDRRGAAGVLATLGVVVGLFGMHVLGLHGVQHDDAAPAMVSSTSHGHGAHEAAAEAECCNHGHDMSVLMLCLAFLVASGVLAAVASGRGRRALALARTAQCDRWLVASPARAGPPYSMAYSVLRC